MGASAALLPPSRGQLQGSSGSTQEARKGKTSDGLAAAGYTVKLYVASCVGWRCQDGVALSLCRKRCLVSLPCLLRESLPRYWGENVR